MQSKPLPGLSARLRWPPKWMPATALQTVVRLAALLAEEPSPAAGGPFPADEGPFPADERPFPADQGPFPAAGGLFPAAGQHEYQRGCEMGPLQALLAFCSVSHLSSCIHLFIQSISHLSMLSFIHLSIHSFSCTLFGHSVGPSTCVCS